jgi:hypothetical protein
MASISLWSGGHRRNDHQFLDRIVSEWFEISGTTMCLHKYIGVHDHTDDGPRSDDVSTIQDPLYLENRDRKYDRDVYELRCVYGVANGEVDILRSDPRAILIDIERTADISPAIRSEGDLDGYRTNGRYQPCDPIRRRS